MAGEQSTEREIFTKHYASLCTTLTDINNLLPFFVQEQIINFHVLEEISAITTTLGKLKKLLSHISGPLTAGNAMGFLKMLTIMKEHGSQATKDLAAKMNSEMEALSIEREPEANRSATSGIDFSECEDIARGFSLMVAKLPKILESANFSALKRGYLMKIPNGLQLPDGLKTKIEKAVSLDALLDALVESKYWNFADLRLVEILVMSSGIREAKALIDKYKEVFFSVKLVDVLNSCIHTLLPKIQENKYMSTVGSKISKEPDEITVADLSRYCTILETVIMDIHNGCCIPSHIEEGCIKIHWLIPIQYCLHAYKSALKNCQKFHSLHLEYLEIGSYPVIYDYCSNAIRKINEHYQELLSFPTDIIPFEGFLDSGEIEIIRPLPTDEEKMKYLLNEIILPSLHQNNSRKFSDFVRVLANSDYQPFIDYLNKLELQQKIGELVKGAEKKQDSTASSSGEKQEKETMQEEKNKEEKELAKTVMEKAKAKGDSTASSSGEKQEKETMQEEKNRKEKELAKTVMEKAKAKGVTVPAYLPPDCLNWMGDIESIFLDEHEGEFNFDKHGVTIIVPPGAITSGMKAELKFGAALFAPVKFEVNTIPVSAIFWFSMSKALQKPVKIQMEHGISIKSKAQANNLQFAKANHLKNDYILKAIDGGRFIIGESFGTIDVDHFCYYCIEYNGYNENPPTYKYQAVLFQNKQLQNGVLKLQICIMASLTTCKTKTKEQFNKDWESKWILREFLFDPESQKINIQFDEPDERKIITYPIDGYNQSDVDFYEACLTNGKKDELKCKMDNKDYPPRFHCEVVDVTNSQDYFTKPNILLMKFNGVKIEGKDCENIPIAVPILNDSKTNHRKHPFITFASTVFFAVVLLCSKHPWIILFAFSVFFALIIYYYKCIIIYA